MKNLHDKQKNIGKDLLEFHKIFDQYDFSEQELKELKNHFDEMAGFLVDAWLERKKSLAKASKKLYQACQKLESEI